MKNPNKYLRKSFIDLLSNNVIYNGEPIEVIGQSTFESNYPFIRVYSYNSQEANQNQSTFIQEIRTNIEIVFRYPSDSGGETDADNAVDSILQIIRNRNSNIDLIQYGFNVFTCVCENIDTFEDNEDDFKYIRKIILVSNKIEQLNGI